jgi:hypothetical protein
MWIVELALRRPLSVTVMALPTVLTPRALERCARNLTSYPIIFMTDLKRTFPEIMWL